MSDQKPNGQKPHGASKIEPTREGGGGKWLIGAAVAAVLLGGGYYAWQNSSPMANNAEIAYQDVNEPYASEPLPLSPSENSDQLRAESAATDEDVTAAPARAATTPAPRRASSSTTAAAPVPQETIGVSPNGVASANASVDDRELIVRAPQRPVWASTPSPRRLTALYPARALERGDEGEADLACTVQQRGALDCESVSATPGFSNAALRVARTLRHAPQTANGADAAGTPVNLRVVFRIADEPRRGRA